MNTIGGIVLLAIIPRYYSAKALPKKMKEYAAEKIRTTYTGDKCIDRITNQYGRLCGNRR